MTARKPEQRYKWSDHFSERQQLQATIAGLVEALEEASLYVKGCGLDGKVHVRVKAALASARSSGGDVKP